MIKCLYKKCINSIEKTYNRFTGYAGSQGGTFNLPKKGLKLKRDCRRAN